MPANYVIDPERRIVFSTATGVLTAADFRDRQERLRQDPAFSRTFRELFDFTAVTRFDLPNGSVIALAESEVFGPSARRAFVVATELGYGLMRMFAGFRELKGDEKIGVFRDREKAEAWLDAPDGETRAPFR